MWISRKGGLQYVHRGNAVAYDYDQTTLTQDASWHTMDLSAIIPANAKLVHLRVGVKASAAQRFFEIAKVGVTAGYASSGIFSQVANIWNETEMIVDCTGQQVGYWTIPAAFTSLSICVIGWFL